MPPNPRTPSKPARQSARQIVRQQLATRAAAQQQERARLLHLVDRWLIGDMRLSPQAYRSAVTALAKIYPGFTVIWQHIQTSAPIRHQPDEKTWQAFNLMALTLAKPRMPHEIRGAFDRMTRLLPASKQRR